MHLSDMIKKSKRPPTLAKWLITRMTDYQEQFAIVGDVEEVFYILHEEKGRIIARLWYWYQCVVGGMRYGM